MRTHTTLTDVRRIMHLHTVGLSTEEISQDVFINPLEVARIIAIKFPKKRAKKAVESAA